LATRINLDTDHDVFTNNWGHIKTFEVAIHLNGWSNKKPFRDEDYEFSYDTEDQNDSLYEADKVIKRLEELLYEF